MALTQWLLAAALIIIGLILEFVEIFIPSFGLLVLSGLLAFAGAVYVVHDATHSALAVGATVAAILFLLILDLIAAVKLLPRSPMVLRYRQAQNPETSRLSALVGRRARASSPLRPAGKVRIEETVYDAEAADRFIDEGAAVEVTAVRVGRLVVRRVDPATVRETNV